jgi:hypothetical protein
MKNWLGFSVVVLLVTFKIITMIVYHHEDINKIINQTINKHKEVITNENFRHS